MKTNVIARIQASTQEQVDRLADEVTALGREGGRFGVRDAVSRSEVVRAAIELLLETHRKDPDGMRRRLLEVVTDGRAPGRYDLGTPVAEITAAVKAGGEDGIRTRDRVRPYRMRRAA